jgi:hypothetical protein
LLPVETLESIDTAILAARADRQLPCALQSIGSQEPDLIASIVRLQPGLRVHDGYVITQRLGARLRRTLGVHAVLGHAGRPLEPADLMSQYRAAFPSDDCTFRDIELVVAQWPHLFLEVTEGVWASVGKAAPLKAIGGEVIEDLDLVEPDLADLEAGDEEPDEDALTLAGALEADLRRTGPTRLADILERAPSILPPGRSVNSVGPTLLLYKDRFVRGLPGLYALIGQLPSDEGLLARPPSYLLQDDVVRGYVLARRAGEGYGAFPLWRPATEVVWCEWARQEADSPLFESLMSVVRPDLWPVDADRRGAWAEIAKARGAFRIGFQPNPASVILPALDRVMAALKVVAVDGALGWTKANRILMRRMRDHQAVGLLAVLVAFGALEAGEDWQAPHVAGSAVADLLSALDDACSIKGSLHWETEIGEALMARLRRARPQGWVTEEVLSTIVSRWEGGAELLAQLLEPPLSPLDQLLKEQAALDRVEGLDGLLRDVAQGHNA